jgi:hypothetical protein
MDAIQFIKDLFHQPYFISFLAVVTCLCFYYLKSQNRTYEKIVWIAYSSIFASTLSIFIFSAIYRIYHPEVWDFTAFYIYGKVAALGYNFYLPENFHLVFNSLSLPTEDGFRVSVLNVGFLYPPPTILYFLPLGFLSFKTALIVWTIFNFIFVFGCLYLIYELFLKSYKLNGILLVSILFFIFLPSLSTINFSQTNFILLFYLLLLKKYSNKNISGVFLALAFFTKPYMIIFGLFFLLRMKWKTIIYCVLTTLALVGILFVSFGKEIFISYIFDNPSHRLPEWVFSEGVNQSLNAVLLRNNLISLSAPITYIFIVAGILFTACIYLYYLSRNKLYDYIWALLLLVGLLIYPGTLSHYGTLLLFIIFQFIDEKEQLGLNLYVCIPIVGIFYYLSTISIFSSICFILIVVFLKSFNIFNQFNLLYTRYLVK